MKTRNRYLVITALAAPLLLTACADNDVYDPDKVRPVPPVENPLGDDFVAPDGFDWSMITTVKLDIEVKDELNGQYNYLAEVFTTNPLSDKTATPIAAGYAKGGSNFVAEISIPKSTERIFIRQTDPKQRKEVYEFTTPENGGTLNCKLYYTGGTTTRSTTGSTSAFNAAIAAGVKELEDKTYTEEVPVIPAVPDKSDDPINQYNPNAFNDGARIVIPAGKEDNTAYRMQSGKGTIFVKGTLIVKNLTSQFDIYVLNGGKIEFIEGRTFTSFPKVVVEKGGTIETKEKFGMKNGEWFIGGTFIANADVIFEPSVTSTTIASDATITVNNGIFRPNSQVFKNFGTIIAANLTTTQGNTTEIYNAGTIEVAEELYINNTNFYNKSEVNAGTFKMNNNSNVLNQGKISTHDFDFITSTLSNYGMLLVDEQTGTFGTNNTKAASMINHYEGIVKGYRLSGGMSFYNDGFGEFTFFENKSVDMLYNSCTLIVKEKFLWTNVTLDNGSITGGKPDNLSATENNASLWKPVPEMSNSSPANYTLKNGSMIKASLYNVTNAPNYFKGEGNNPSLLQLGAVHISNRSDTYLSDLVLEMPENAFTYSNGATGINNGRWLTTGVSTTGWEESKYTFSTCGGYYNPGNPGNPDPEDPEKPVIVDNTVYTYAFEDNWPVYGDFDLNDIVTSIDKITITQRSNGSIESYKLNGTLQAVGASKKLGLGIRFLGFNTSNVTELKGNIKGTTQLSFESNQSNPVVIICNDAHLFMGNAENDRGFINTLEDNSNNKDGVKFEISIGFKDGAVKLEDININKIDMFVISREADAKSKRSEIHVAGYTPTDLGNAKQFGLGNDNSSVTDKRYYLSKENLAWGVVIPSEFAWPLEYKNVKNVYEDFAGWVISGGKDNKDWYKNHNGQIFKK